MDSITKGKYLRVANRVMGQYRSLFLLEEHHLATVRPIIERDLEEYPPDFENHQLDIKARVEHFISRDLPLGQISVLLKNCQDQIKNNLEIANQLGKLEARLMIQRYKEVYDLEIGDYLIYREMVPQPGGKEKLEKREGWLAELDTPYPRLDYHLGQVRSGEPNTKLDQQEMYSVVAFVNLRTVSGKRSKKFTPFLGRPEDITLIKDASGKIKKDIEAEEKSKKKKKK